MLRRLTALVFVLALAGGALARAPFHVCEQECDMHRAAAAEETGCAGSHAAAETSKPTPRALACDDCWSPGQSQAPAAGTQRAPQPSLADPHSAPPPQFVPGAMPHVSQSLSHPPSSKPAFIRHHALLI